LFAASCTRRVITPEETAKAQRMTARAPRLKHSREPGEHDANRRAPALACVVAGFDLDPLIVVR